MLNKFNILCFTLILPALAHAACPDVAGLPDINCDQAATVVVLGDSIVAGTGDTAKDNSGGYITRTQKRFPEARIIGYGVPGLRTLTLLSRVNSALSDKRYPELALDLRAADLIVLDLGRNDRWLFGLPAATLRNLKRIRDTLSNKLKKQQGSAPLIAQAVLLLPNRGSQGPWVKELNQLILNSHSDRYPCDIRFDLISKRLLSADNIHPTSKGYQAIAESFSAWLRKEYPRYARLLQE
jgi:lysophospholipase L1-like esterase